MNMKKIVLSIFIVLTLVSVLGAKPTDTRHFSTNPAFLANSKRGTFEIGLPILGFEVTNSYLSIGEIIGLASAKDFTLDLNKLYTSLGDGGLEYGFTLENALFSTVHIGQLGVGFFTRQETYYFSSLPKSFFGILANGNQLDVPITGESNIILQSFAETGLYGSWKLDNFVFAGTLDAYFPLAYADNAKFNYSFVARSNGTASFSASANLPMYTFLDAKAVSNSSGNFDSAGLTSDAISSSLSSSMGFNVDAGFMYRHPKSKKPMWGGALLNIPLIPAKAGSKLNANLTYSAEIANLLANTANIADAVTSTESQPAKVEASENFVLMPMKANGFYRFELLPFLDVTPQAELVFWNPTRLNLGVNANVYLGDWIDFGVGVHRNDFVWKAETELALNLYIFELAISAAVNGPDIGSMFTAKGLEANIFIALGF